MQNLVFLVQMLNAYATCQLQQASCTLEAGVKIYSTRVDSVHSETYKVLGGLNRTAGDDNSNGEYILICSLNAA